MTADAHKKVRVLPLSSKILNEIGQLNGASGGVGRYGDEDDNDGDDLLKRQKKTKP